MHFRRLRILSFVADAIAGCVAGICCWCLLLVSAAGVSWRRILPDGFVSFPLSLMLSRAV